MSYCHVMSKDSVASNSLAGQVSDSEVSSTSFDDSGFISPNTVNATHPAKMQHWKIVGGIKRFLRPIIIDGMNVAHAGPLFSFCWVDVVARHWLEEGHLVRIVLMPLSPQLELSRGRGDQSCRWDLLDELEQMPDLVVWANAGYYDDLLTIQIAASLGGIVVSRDKFKDCWKYCHTHELQNVIKNRILNFKFVDGIYHPALDPVGRRGPILAEFVLFPAGETPPQPKIARAQPQLSCASITQAPSASPIRQSSTPQGEPGERADVQRSRKRTKPHPCYKGDHRKRIKTAHSPETSFEVFSETVAKIGGLVGIRPAANFATPQKQTSGLVGQPVAAIASTTHLFGTLATPDAGFSSLFGGVKPSPQKAPLPSSSVFGAAAQASQPPIRNLFGQAHASSSMSVGRFSFVVTASAATASKSTFGGQATATFTGLFGAAGKRPSFFGAKTLIFPDGSGLAKFSPSVGQDVMMRNNATHTINTRLQCITEMQQYELKSCEELRFEDYLANRKGPEFGSSKWIFVAETSISGPPPGFFRGQLAVTSPPIATISQSPASPKALAACSVAASQPSSAATVGLFGASAAGPSNFGGATTSTAVSNVSPSTALPTVVATSIFTRPSLPATGATCTVAASKPSTAGTVGLFGVLTDLPSIFGGATTTATTAANERSTTALPGVVATSIFARPLFLPEPVATCTVAASNSSTAGTGGHFGVSTALPSIFGGETTTTVVAIPAVVRTNIFARPALPATAVFSFSRTPTSISMPAFFGAQFKTAARVRSVARGGVSATTSTIAGSIASPALAAAVSEMNVVSMPLSMPPPAYVSCSSQPQYNLSETVSVALTPESKLKATPVCSLFGAASVQTASDDLFSSPAASATTAEVSQPSQSVLTSTPKPWSFWIGPPPTFTGAEALSGIHVTASDGGLFRSVASTAATTSQLPKPSALANSYQHTNPGNEQVLFGGKPLFTAAVFSTTTTSRSTLGGCSAGSGRTAGSFSFTGIERPSIISDGVSRFSGTFGPQLGFEAGSRIALTTTSASVAPAMFQRPSTSSCSIMASNSATPSEKLGATSSFGVVVSGEKDCVCMPALLLGQPKAITFRDLAATVSNSLPAIDGAAKCAGIPAFIF